MITIQHTSKDNGRDPYWDSEIYNQELLQFQHVLDDIEHYQRSVHENPPITHNKKTQALIENWQMNDDTNHPVFPNPLGIENPGTTTEVTPQCLLDEKQFQNFHITKDCEPACIPLWTNINLKSKKRIVYFPIDFGELTIDGLIDTGDISTAIPEMDPRKSDFSFHTLLSGKVLLRISKYWSQMDNESSTKSS